MIDCINKILSDGLLVNIDLTNSKSWDGNDEYSVYSLSKWNDSIVSDLELKDYGLTQFDFGLTNKMYDKFEIKNSEVYLKLNRVKHNVVNNPTNRETTGTTVTTINNSYDISGVTGTTSGAYFQLNGGYLNGFYKLDGYDYQILPHRYRKGITIETILNFNESTNGIFLFLGARSEDKYNPHYIGEFNNEEPSGVHTSEINYLESLKPEKVLQKSFKNPEEKEKIEHFEVNQIDNLKNNAIAFYVSKDKNFGYKYIDEKGNLVFNESEYQHTETGFTYLNIMFKPNDIMPETVNINCPNRRQGELTIYVNGVLVWLVKDFNEFYFRSLINDKEKQIAVPYNISWGGGTFGLRHSYHYDIQEYKLFENDDINYLENNFSVSTDKVLCDINNEHSNENSIRIYNSGTTSGFTFYYDNPIAVLSNREYEVEVDVYNSNLFNLKGKVSIVVESNETEIFVFNETNYEFPTKKPNNWFKVKTKFAIEDNVGQKNIRIGVNFEPDYQFNLGGSIYLSNFVYSGADILVQDKTKKNLFMENNFSNSFIGGIQKLRIYDRVLSLEEIRHNGMIEMNSRLDNAFVISNGGRIIKNVM